MTNQYFAVCTAPSYLRIIPFGAERLSRMTDQLNNSNERIERMTGERPWHICTNERPEQFGSFEFVPNGYNGHPEIRDIATQICVRELTE